jgi:endo-1,4-beta-D-glucanase Y
MGSTMNRTLSRQLVVIALVLAAALSVARLLGVTSAAVQSSCLTANSGGAWQNAPFASQNGAVTAEFDATPSVSPINSVIGLSRGAQNAYAGFGALARFNPSGAIDARNGGAYAAASTIPYSANVSYHFRLVVNVPAHTYSVYVTPAGGAELTVGTNFAFRTEQNTVTSLDWWGVYVNSTPVGSTTVCNFIVNQPGQAPTISSHPTDKTVQDGQSVSFSVTASGTAPLNYQWQKNGANISGATSSSYTITAAAADNGALFRCVVTNAYGSATSNSARLTVTSSSSCVTATAGGPWQNTSFASQSDTFTAEFDATPSVSPINGVVGLSQGAQSAYAGFATLARFNPSGAIDARNGGAYAAASTIPYAGNVTYHFRLVIDVPAHTYSIYVKPTGGAELPVGTNFAFRTEQNTVSSLSWWGANVASTPAGSLRVCNFTTSDASPPPPPPGVNRPFPQNLNYPGCIKPNNVTQASINDSIRSYYNYWKTTYVRQSNGVTPGGGYYVFMQGTGGTGDEITTSEAHGYGMMIFALMAGYDSQSKQYFDGMFNMFDKHRSTGDSDNMSWVIDRSELTSRDQGSATDGDMDVGYALLLAHYQWGSDGNVNYLDQARRIITNGVKDSDMSLSTKRSLLGDWSTDQLATRASDWMTDHFRAYQQATGDSFWNDATNTVYGLINQITTNYAPNTGLMPDFVVGSPARPAPPNFLEADTDDDYSWNSCRYPWRLATAFAHYGTPETRSAANKVINWLKNQTGGNPGNIRAGYRLDGTPMAPYGSAAFTSPFIAACIVDSSHQTYLNSGWITIRNWRESYYGDTINLLCMLLISGNWWAPV